MRLKGRGILRTSSQHPTHTTSSPPLVTPSIPGSPIQRSPFQTPPSLHQQSLQVTLPHLIQPLRHGLHPVGASSLAPSPITASGQGLSPSKGPTPDSPESERLLPEEMYRLSLIQQHIPQGWKIRNFGQSAWEISR